MQEAAQANKHRNRAVPLGRVRRQGGGTHQDQGISSLDQRGDISISFLMCVPLVMSV